MSNEFDRPDNQAAQQNQQDAEHAAPSTAKPPASAAPSETGAITGGSSSPGGAPNDSRATDGFSHPQPPLAPTAPVDPFDLSRLRLSQDFASKLAVKKELVAVPVSKRHRQEWFRVHSNPTMRVTTTLLEWKEDGLFYLVDPIVAAELSGEVFLAELFVTINKNGDLNLWPVRLPGDDGKWHEAHRTSFEAAQLAFTKWVRMVWNKPLGAYDIFTADYTDPEWPAVNLQTLVKIAFKERFIRTADHPIARSLRGV